MRETYEASLKRMNKQAVEEKRFTKAQKLIWVTFQKEGIHKYPDAPEGVEFLKYPHRHMFKFRVAIQVFHDDRELEFILFKR